MEGVFNCHQLPDMNSASHPAGISQDSCNAAPGSLDIPGIIIYNQEALLSGIMFSEIKVKDARLVHKVYRSTAPGLPMSAYDDLTAFKIYLVDLGLLRRLAQLAPTAFGEGNRLFTEFKGALTENYVLQTLVTQFEVMPRYWSQSNPPYEVDFLIQRENDIFPVEVKSEANTTSRSLRKFKELFSDQVKLRVRFSLDNLKLDDDVLNIPLFMADQADRLIGLALNERVGG